MDFLQLTIIIAVFTLTFFLGFTGVQIFFLLKELRGTLGKADKILDDVSKVSESSVAPITNFTRLVSSVGNIFNFLGFLEEKKHK